MWNFPIFGIELYYVISYLIIFSVLGWLWETVYVSIKEKRVVNRGYVMGPVCTIYGFGAVSVYMILRPFNKNIVVLFLCGIVITTIIEYYTALVMETLFHTSWWDYTYAKFNYKGRICLKSSLAWGVCSVLLFHVLLPFANNIIAVFTKEQGERLICIIGVVYAVDFAGATIAAIDVAQYIEKMDGVLGELEDMVKSSRLYIESSEVREKMGGLRARISNTNYIKRYSRRIEIISTLYMDQLGNESDKFVSELQNKMAFVTDKIKISNEWAGLQKQRIITAYPNMKSKAQLKRELKQK